MGSKDENRLHGGKSSGVSKVRKLRNFRKIRKTISKMFSLRVCVLLQQSLSKKRLAKPQTNLQRNQKTKLMSAAILLFTSRCEKSTKRFIKTNSAAVLLISAVKSTENCYLLVKLET